MKINSFLFIIGVMTIVSIFAFYLELGVLLLPLLIGLFILIKFGNNDHAKYISLLSLKPVFSGLLLAFESKYDLTDKLDAFISYEAARSILWVVPELILTLAIVYLFRHLFRGTRVIRLFLIGDVIRWLIIFICLWIPNPSPEPYFYLQLYVLIFFAVIFPSIYALYGLSIIWRHNEFRTSAS